MPTPGTTTSPSRDQLAADGIDPDHPFSRSERRVGSPVDVRVGDNRVIRRNDGGITVSIGYFGPGQQAARQAWSDRLLAEFERARP